jgi:hypothetical protein
VDCWGLGTRSGISDLGNSKVVRHVKPDAKKRATIRDWDEWQRWLASMWSGKCGETYMCESLSDIRVVVCGFM